MFIKICSQDTEKQTIYNGKALLNKLIIYTWNAFKCKVLYKNVLNTMQLFYRNK